MSELSERENMEARISGHYIDLKAARVAGDEVGALFHEVSCNTWLETLHIYLGQTATEGMVA